MARLLIRLRLNRLPGDLDLADRDLWPALRAGLWRREVDLLLDLAPFMGVGRAIELCELLGDEPRLLPVVDADADADPGEEDLKLLALLRQLLSCNWRSMFSEEAGDGEEEEELEVEASGAFGIRSSFMSCSAVAPLAPTSIIASEW